MPSMTAKSYFQENFFFITAISAICKKLEMSFQLDKWKIKYKTFSSCQYLLEIQAFCVTCLYVQLSVIKCTECLQYFFITLNEQRYINYSIIYQWERKKYEKINPNTLSHINEFHGVCEHNFLPAGFQGGEKK